MHAKVYTVFKEQGITMHKVYHVQLKQFHQRHVSTKLRRFVKVDGKLVDDYKIEDQTISGEIGFYVRDIFKKSGAHIYNLKVTEWLEMYNFYFFFLQIYQKKNNNF